MADEQDGVEDAPGKTAGGGESEGGAYPNPHKGQTRKTGGFFGHGGQTDIAYSGTGGVDDPEAGNAKAVTKGD